MSSPAGVLEEEFLCSGWCEVATNEEKGIYLFSKGKIEEPKISCFDGWNSWVNSLYRFLMAFLITQLILLTASIILVNLRILVNPKPSSNLEWSSFFCFLSYVRAYQFNINQILMQTVSIKNFKSYQQQLIHGLSPNINVILGKNGQGKSNLFKGNHHMMQLCHSPSPIGFHSIAQNSTTVFIGAWTLHKIRMWRWR